MRLFSLVRAAPAAAAALALAAASSGAQSAATPSVDIPVIPVERLTLANGLTVLLSPDHSAPVVAVSVWYHVGSKNEKPGRTGFAHLFEHVMFMGSQHVPTGSFDQILEAAGGNNNGSTTNDRTNYYETLPSNALATALWLESDRMGWLLPTLDQAKLDAQREVVKNERRQRVDNQPFGSQFEVIAAALYPATNPYSWPVIGSMADLSAASVDDVKDFFRKYYAPNNATMVITGDIDVDRTRAMVASYFAEIPRGPAIDRPVVAPASLDKDKRLVLTDAKSRLPQISFVWSTVGEDHEDRFPLAALGEVMAQDRTSRLTKLLVYDRQLATNVGVFQGADENAGQFIITIRPRPGIALSDIERLTDSVVAGLVAAPPTAAEVERYKNSYVVSTVTALQSVLEKGEVLASGQAFHGDPAFYATELKKSIAVSPGDVQRVASLYLSKGHVVLSMVPAGHLEMISRPDLPYSDVTPTPATAGK